MKTPFIYISESMVQKKVNLPRAFKAIEKSYALFSSGKTVTPHTIAMQAGKGTLFAFPAFLLGEKTFICKLATFFPQNRQKGLPSIQPNIFVYSSATGELQCIISARYFAGVRTAITSAVGIKYLGCVAPKKMAIIGSGVQARSHGQVISALFPSIKYLAIFSPSQKSRELCARELAKKLPKVKVEAVSAAASAVADADIIACVTDSPTPVFSAKAVKSGACILAVGSMGAKMQEVPDEVMAKASVVVDSQQQVDSYGEIMGPRSRKVRVQLAGEIGQFVLGKKKINRGKTTVFKHHGLPVTDAALANTIISN